VLNNFVANAIRGCCPRTRSWVSQHLSYLRMRVTLFNQMHHFTLAFIQTRQGKLDCVSSSDHFVGINRRINVNPLGPILSAVHLFVASPSQATVGVVNARVKGVFSSPPCRVLNFIGHGALSKVLHDLLGNVLSVGGHTYGLVSSHRVSGVEDPPVNLLAPQCLIRTQEKAQILG